MPISERDENSEISLNIAKYKHILSTHHRSWRLIRFTQPCQPPVRSLDIRIGPSKRNFSQTPNGSVRQGGREYRSQPCDILVRHISNPEPLVLFLLSMFSLACPIWVYIITFRMRKGLRIGLSVLTLMGSLILIGAVATSIGDKAPPGSIAYDHSGKNIILPKPK